LARLLCEFLGAVLAAEGVGAHHYRGAVNNGFVKRGFKLFSAQKALNFSYVVVRGRIRVFSVIKVACIKGKT